MVIDWILIIFLVGTTPASIEFESKAACKAAEIELSNTLPFGHVKTTIKCFKKYVKEKQTR